MCFEGLITQSSELKKTHDTFKFLLHVSCDVKPYKTSALTDTECMLCDFTISRLHHSLRGQEIQFISMKLGFYLTSYIYISGTTRTYQILLFSLLLPLPCPLSLLSLPLLGRVSALTFIGHNHFVSDSKAYLDYSRQLNIY